MSDNKRKEEKVSKAVGEALDTMFATVAEERKKKNEAGSTDSVVVSMDFHPTEGGVYITNPTTLETMMGEDVVNL